MGWYKSFIWVDDFDVKKNNEGVEKLLAMFKKYGVRCEGDPYGECTNKLHFNKRVGEFKKGTEMLVMFSEGHLCENISLFDGQVHAVWEDLWDEMREEDPSLTEWKGAILTNEEFAFLGNVKIRGIEEFDYVFSAEKTGKVTVEKLALQLDKK